MKKTLFLLFLIFNFSFLISAATPQEGAHIAFEQTEYDFGDVPHSSKKIECTFAFTNDGTEPLVITRTMVSCSCVKVSYDKHPIAPGASGIVTVVYEVSKKDPGVFYKVIDVNSNSTGGRVSLIVKGNAVE